MSQSQPTDVQRRSKEFFSVWSANKNTYALSEDQLESLAQISDLLIPGLQPWPLPSTLEIKDYFRRGASTKVDVDMLSFVVDRLSGPLAQSQEATEAAMHALQKESPAHYRALLEFSYYAYYAQPEVVRVIRTELNCDYISPPQPRGYVMSSERVVPVGVGSFVPTEKIARVDLANVNLVEE